MRAFLIALLLCLPLSAAHAFNASHYGHGDGYFGKRTACGNIHRPGLTVAHRNLPCGTKVRLTNTANGLSAIYTVTDRGPFVRGRVWDLNSVGKDAIGLGDLGNVKAEIIR